MADNLYHQILLVRKNLPIAAGQEVDRRIFCGALITEIFSRALAASGILSLEALSGVSHSLRVHILAFEKIEVHFAEPVSEYDPHELRVFQAVVFLGEIGALAILVRPAGAEDIGHREGQGPGLVFQECLFDGYVEAVISLQVAL